MKQWKWNRKERGNRVQNHTKQIQLFILLGFVMAMTVSATGCQSGAITKKSTAKKVETNSEKKMGAKETANIKKNIKLALGEVGHLTVGEDENIISCKSSKTEVATVSENGTVHARKSGTAKITAECQQDDKTVTRTYKVTVKKRGMVYPVFSMMKGEHLDLQFSSAGTKAVWKSSNTAVAKVTKAGKITAKKKGSAIITGTAKDGKIYRCNLKVTKRIKSVIYLTFDDGPNRYTTPKILKILKKNNVKATFFELKPAKNDFDLTKRVLDEGHTLAMHGYQHKYDIVYRSQKIYRNNLDQLRNLFFKKFGVWCTVTRFPGGSSNTVSSYNKGIMTKLTQKLDGWGYHYFDWNVDSCDAGGAKTARDTYRNVTNSLQKGRANVVLMHDFYKNDKTINALDKIIKYGKKNGFTFLPITAATDEIHHSVNN